ncbi:hypothetical protein [Nostoc sp.]|uniref:hypothetical protein n=1 Tax=Nostoc sp. TaxID=1180 RepID=UPI002FF54587
MSKINIDTSRLNRAIQLSFDVVVETLADSFSSAILDDSWEWPRTTIRQNSDVVSSPRDIYDTGELYNSLVISRSANAAEYTWESDHAAIVHDGATTKNGTELPARPWTKIGLEECNAAEIMQQQLNKYL